jgi:hypothetical protein
MRRPPPQLLFNVQILPDLGIQAKAPAPLTRNNGAEIANRPLKHIVDDHILVLVEILDFLPGLFQAALDLFGGVTPPGPKALF